MPADSSIGNSSILAALLLSFIACHPRSTPVAASREPRIAVRDAPLLQFRGANSPYPEKPGDVDCNSPAHWDGGTLYLFNSSGHPWRLSGPDLSHLDRDYRRVEYNNQVIGGRWIECTWKAGDGILYGWYHWEPSNICPGSHPEGKGMSLTAPRIGAVRSGDNGATWEDLGVILEAPPWLKCDTRNFYFAGGNGDFSAMLDARQEYLYFFLSNYAGETEQQGVAVARLAWKDRNTPVGCVWKWHNGKWSERGLGGSSTPVFPAKVDWHRSDADAFWGPSIHWNHYLKQYVILLNRAVDARWKQEGIYVSFSHDLSDPSKWSVPKKILDSPGPNRWYPQVMGLNAATLDTDKAAGKVARLFVRGVSRWEIEFYRGSESRTEISR
jgi:hypothetical protein